MTYDFQEITLHVTESLDWSYTNPRYRVLVRGIRGNLQIIIGTAKRQR